MARLVKMRRVGATSTVTSPKPQQGRKNANRDIYKKRRWTNFSRDYRKDNPLCVECLKLDIVTDCSPGKRTGVTDHIVPINKGGEVFDRDNCQTLCNYHHNSKSAKDK